MKQFLSIVPIPTAGVALGTMALCKLFILKDFEIASHIFAIISILLLLSIFLKAIIFPRQVQQEMKNPIIASVAPASMMSFLLLCSYSEHFHFFSSIVPILWWLGVIGELTLITYFTIQFIFKVKWSIKNVFPSWFIVFVGQGIISITSIDFAPTFGKIMLIVTVVWAIILVPLVLYRLFVVKQMPEPTMPLATILTAPVSISLAGYLTLYSHIHFSIVVIGLLLSQTLYVIVLLLLIRLIRLPFYPSYAAFTFPLVITATALTLANHYLEQNGYQINWIQALVPIETIIAIIMVSYVVCRYVYYFFLMMAKPNIK